jgi:hypothetical protein
MNTQIAVSLVNEAAKTEENFIGFGLIPPTPPPVPDPDELDYLRWADDGGNNLD